MRRIADREMEEQVLDSMDLERERGITIKAHSVTVKYKSQKMGKLISSILLITPGHVDFSMKFLVTRCV